MIDRIRIVPTLVVGSGVAGLSTALALEGAVVVTKTALGEGSSRWAQGGIAAAVDPADDVAAHAADTIAVSGGLADRAVARLVTAAGPDRIRWLSSLGADFDRSPDGVLAMGHEAGHSHRRIVRADGDASGAELMRALVAAVRLRDDLEIVEHTLALDLVRAGDRIAGAVTRDPDGGRTAWLAGAVVLSTGGIGRLYRHTTNPVEATGDGLAMALRAGAAVADLEFVQFHPTALDSPLDPMPLLTEALRGEGAQLIDGNGVRYMPSVHPDAELAPRDVVARANWERREAGIPIYLDATHLGDRFAARFPTVYRLAVAAGFDPTVMPLPVSPAQHYHMGGIATDPHGRTSQPGLWACGEVSSTGLHGANRLASNSLLEGLVFAGRIAASITSSGLEPPSLRRAAVPADLADRSRQATGEIDQVRDTMWRLVGVVRSATGLREAQRRFAAARREAPAGELRTALTVAAAVADAALSRTESRGSHQRADHPAPDPAQARRSYRTPRPVPYLPVRVPTRGAA